MSLLVLYGPIWSSMVQYGPIGSPASGPHSWKASARRYTYNCVWSYMVQYGPIEKPYCRASMRPALRASVRHWSYMVLYGPIHCQIALN
jgi:hypothetical protein